MADSEPIQIRQPAHEAKAAFAHLLRLINRRESQGYLNRWEREQEVQCEKLVADYFDQVAP